MSSDAPAKRTPSGGRTTGTPACISSGSAQPIWSARVGAHHRAVALWEESETVWWFWIGTHAEYDALLKRL